jgi:hypothetical protein
VSRFNLLSAIGIHDRFDPVLESEAEEVFGHAKFPGKKFESVSKSLKVSDLR